MSQHNQLSKMSFHSVFYCPICKSKELMVDDDEKYVNREEYNYHCMDCNNSFEINIVKS